ncbi:hypothetical protein M408DRAFT_191560 [Serendipita vermifera MAFF 305830]|uniref:Uncharacterized protein n=1 Tax=Serendipita vermifera MAFF 305830 TaxID=933852 RepID=A0A0C3BLZ8_SERVB|nr:hypothetical protein M408DRAFT_191560 [Serendipita vermifera MAFF 305830]
MRRTLILFPRVVRTFEISRRTMETPVVDQRKRVRSPAQLARQKAKEASHKERMGQLEGEIQGILNANLATEPIMEGRIRTKEMIEHALQNKFGQTVRVESIGLDRLGLHLGQAPLELAVVDSNGDALAPPDAGNALYQPLALIDALRSSGISARLYSTPNWISSESASRSFALPEPTIINEDMSFILVPPDSSHSLRSSLVEDCIAKCPSMRNVLGLLYIFAARDTETTLPPLASRILSHLAMAYYRYRYGTLAPSNASKSVPILSFYCHPSSTMSPDGSHDVSSDVQEPIMVSVSQPSDFSPSRKATSTVASELLDLLR